MTQNVWLSARALLSGFGEDAAYQAGVHARDCAAAGDWKGARAWRLVARAVEELKREPREGDRLN